MNAPLYTTEILQLAASLSEPHELEHGDGVAALRSPTCGSRMETTVQIDPQGRVEALSQVVLACAFGQASAALLEQGAIGRARSDIKDAHDRFAAWLESSPDEPDWPGILALAPARSRKARHGAMLLPFRTLIAAMDAAARE
jgi:NifU-like protein involved in Fe-S cluster formation